MNVVLITAPVGAPAKRMAKQILKARLAACVNLVPKVSSVYWWKGKVESAQETLLIVKTRASLVKKLISFVVQIHPYSVPEIIALPIQAGHKPYLSWLRDETKG